MTWTCTHCEQTIGGKAEHCTASSCHETFGSTKADDAHRVGKFEPNERRCLSLGKLEDHPRLVRNGRGYWMEYRPDRPEQGNGTNRLVNGPQISNRHEGDA